MYKYTVVTDPETAAGFRLAGVEVFEAKSREDAGKILKCLLYADDTGIVALNEDYMSALDTATLSLLEKSYRPILIPIPAPGKGGGGEAYIERLIRRAIGYNVVLRR